MMFQETIEQEVLSDYEIERGKPMPNIIHGAIQGAIQSYLRTHYREQYIFPSELSLATAPPTTPDICIYPTKKLNWREVTAKESEMPITTIEIISPSQTIEALQEKAWDIYFPAGIKSAWIVVPGLKTVQVLRPGGKEQVFSSGTVKDETTGVEIPIEAIFEDLI